MKKPRTKNVVSWVLSLVMIAAGTALLASFFLAGSLNSTSTNSSDPGGFNVPRLDSDDGAATIGPKDKTLKLTIPEMNQIKDDTVPTVSGTDIFRAFFDLNKLEQGDEIYVTDANGTKYTYKVFKEFTVSPTDLSVTDAVPGKNVLTLQTCTLPDYSQRLIIQAELIDTTQTAA